VGLHPLLLGWLYVLLPFFFYIFKCEKVNLLIDKQNKGRKHSIQYRHISEILQVGFQITAIKRIFGFPGI
jgi:hypothetical protein